MHNPEAMRAYTMKIGRVYFDIQPPPSDDGEHDVRHGGGGGMPGGMNPAAMMQAMQAMQGGGM